MRVELDHVFVCTEPGAPEAEKLIQFGLSEGSPNVHPGQGTSNRRFPFSNSMLELLWVHDPDETQNEITAPTLLWERWSARRENACPFGICLRPSDREEVTAPFPGWEYRPSYLPAPLSLHIAEAGIEEPMWVYSNFFTRTQPREWYREHPIGIREITRVTLHTPVPLRSEASRQLMESSILHVAPSSSYGLEIEFDGNRQGQRIDFRPDLPVVFRL